MKRLTNFDLGGLLSRGASAVARRPRLVVTLALLLSVIAVLAATRLEPSAAIDTLVDRDDPAYKATQEFHRDFGDDPIVILAKGKPKTPNALGAMVLTADLGRLLSLEGCLSGNIPRQAQAPAEACERLAKDKPIRVVYGPGTFINEAANQISGEFENEGAKRRAQAVRAARAARKVAAAQGLPPEEQKRLAEAARQLVYVQFARDAAQLALRYGLTSVPALNNPDFVLRLVFEPELGAGVPKPRFAYVFPSENSALIQARLRPGLTRAQKQRTIETVRDAVNDPAFKLKFGSYVVSGVPVVADGVESSVTSELSVLLVVAVILMALTLAIAFRTSRRLLPLALALCAAALTFGAMALFGASLTIAAIAVLPILIGLAVDYAVQFQSRFNEGRGSPAESAAQAARVGGPVILTATAATAIGFLALLLSPVPMVRSFGLVLVLGIVLAFVVALVVGFAVLGGNLRLPPRLRALLGRMAGSRPFRRGRAAGEGSSPAGPARRQPQSRIRRALRFMAGLPRRAATAVRDGSLWLFDTSIAKPGRVLIVATALAVLGWGLGTQVETVSDISKLVPGNQREIRDLNTLQNETGVSGDIDVVVRAKDVTSPRVIRWMSDYQKRVLGRNGYLDGRPCKEANICPALSLTNLFTQQTTKPKQVRALLGALPEYFSQAVITPDRKTANLAFGIRTMPLEDQKRLVDDMRSQLDPPPGVSAQVAGLPVLAADANDRLDSSRWVVTFGGLAAVLFVLLAAYRSLRRALTPLVPVLLATGWSGLVLFCSQIALNPLSATLGALVVAITTEFSVILSARYRDERVRAGDADTALRRTFARTGMAVLVSGITATAGFAALIASDVRILRDFGLVTVIDLAVAIAGVMIVLPAALVWAERRE